RARVVEKLRPQLYVGRGLRIASDRASGKRSVSADLELVADEILQPAIAVDHQDDVRGLSANLEAEGAAGQRQERRRRPSVGGAPAQNAAASHAAEHETRFNRAGEDCNPR